MDYIIVIKISKSPYKLKKNVLKATKNVKNAFRFK
jgi:hypothetical protein